MKLQHIDFAEWADRDVDFEDSEVSIIFVSIVFCVQYFGKEVIRKKIKCLQTN